MRLTTEDGTDLHDPGADELSAALERLGLPGNGYAILGRAEQDYLQTSGSRADGYVIEYREGSEAAHYTSRRTDLPHAQMRDVFLGYLCGGAWKAGLDWTRAGAGGHTRARASGGAALEAWGRALLLAVGIAFLAIGVVDALETRELLHKAVEVPGTVLRLVERRGGDRTTTYRPVVQYVDHQGRTRIVYDVSSSAPPAFYAGEQVVVLYDPADADYPRHARVRTFFELWGFALILTLSGLAFTVMTAAQWWYFRPRGRATLARPLPGGHGPGPIDGE